MNNQPEHMFSPVRSQHMTPEEKAGMRLRVQSFVQQHPVRERMSIRQLWHGFIIPSLSLTSLTKPMVIALVLAVSLAVGGGVTYAAEQSLPGDALYVVKTNVNEAVIQALAVSPEAKTEVQARLVERRLEEAEALAVEGRLSEELRVSIEEHLNKRVEKAKGLVEKFREKKELESAAEASARLEVALRTHERILEKLQMKVNGQAAKLEAKVEEHGDDAEELEASVASQDEEEEDEEEEREEDVEKKERAAEGKLKAASNKLEEVTRFVAKAKISDETRVEAEKRLVEVKKMIADVQAMIDSGTFEEAFEAAKKAHNAAQEVKSYVSAEQAVSARLELKLDEKREEKEEKREQKEERKEERKDDKKDDRRENSRDDDNDDRRDGRRSGRHNKELRFSINAGGRLL